MKAKVKAHLWTSGRWFALPFFGCSALIGSILAGGSLSELNTWLGFIAVALFMACGHSQNTYIDWAVGLDRGEEKSVEKGYTGGCGLISGGILTPREVIFNFTGWFILGLIPAIILCLRVGPYILIPLVLGAAVPYFYTRGKFSWYHETALAAGVVLAAVVGMFAVNPHPEWQQGIVVVLPIAIILSYLGLALDEYPDAHANLKKGTRSLAYRVWESGFDLSTYILAWFSIVYAFQVFLIAIGLLAPLTMISLFVFPFVIAQLVFLKPHADALRNNPSDGAALAGFTNSAKVVVAIAMVYPMLILVGQIVGG
ncbi:hypothetical protein ES705_41604 [subsurface metagenome]